MFAPNGVLNGTGLAGGCTRDLVHRYYQEPYQLDNGKQDRYVTASDAVGLTMGYYATQTLPIYAYLHAAGHPRYAIADMFFQSAFGGSFLNHQWLIAARTPAWPNALNDGSADDLHSVLDSQRDADQLAAVSHDGQRRSRADAIVLAAGQPRPAAGRLHVRRLRRQHDAARLPALRAGHGGSHGACRRRPRRRSAIA